MIRRFTGALAAALGLLAGLWLMLAPVALGTQPKGLDSDWNDPTMTEFVTGAAIAFVGLVGLIAFAMAIREELARRGVVSGAARAVSAGADDGPAATAASAGTAGPVTTAVAEPPRTPEAGVASEDEQLAHLLAPLVEALAEDTRPGARNGAPHGGEYR